MREYDLFVNKVGTVHVRQETDDKFIVTIPSAPCYADPIAHESTLFKHRQATHNNPKKRRRNNPGKPKVEDAAVIARMKLRRGLPRSLTPHERLRRKHAATKPLQALPLPKSKILQNKRSEQIRHRLKG